MVGIADIDIPWGSVGQMHPAPVSSVYAWALHMIDTAIAVARQRRAVRTHHRGL